MTLTAVINPVVPLNLFFPHQRVICPHSCQSAKYIIVTYNFTNDDLTDGNSPSYQSLVNIPPAPLRSPLRPATEETPVPTTRTLSSVPVPPAEPAPFSISTLKTALFQRETFLLYRSQSKSRCPSQYLTISHLPRRIIPRERAQQVSHLRESASRQTVIIFPRNGRKYRPSERSSPPRLRRP